MAKAKRLLSYRAAIKGGIVEMLNKKFPRNMEYGGNRLDKINFDVAYPLQFSVYPHVEVVYKETSIKPSGLGDVRLEESSDRTPYHVWLTEGSIELNIRATNAYEIDLITDGLILALGIDRAMSKELRLLSEYVDIYVASNELKLGVSSAGGMTVYDSDDVSYLQTLSIPTRAQFCVSERMDEFGGIIIESVRLSVDDDSGNLSSVSNIEQDMI